MKVMCVVGARPNFVKAKPVLDAIERAGAEAVFVHTGQHYDHALDAAVFADLDLRRPDHELGVGSGSNAEQVARVLLGLEPLVEQLRPDALVVFGDVNSTLGAALVGAKSSAAVAHVEAGLRSGDWSMPEEVNRVAVDHVSDLLFAPSEDAVANLRREGIDDDRVFLVGNVMVDSLVRVLPTALERPPLVEGRYVLATLHRPALVDDGARLHQVLGALGDLGLPVVLAAHPRTANALASQAVPAAITTVPALGYADFLALEARAALVVTDSGGVQEETTVLGVPCVTVRDSTERPVTVTVGTNRLAGYDPARIVASCREALAATATRTVPELWDGATADRIVAVLLAEVPRRRR